MNYILSNLEDFEAKPNNKKSYMSILNSLE